MKITNIEIVYTLENGHTVNGSIDGNNWFLNNADVKDKSECVGITQAILDYMVNEDY